MQIIWELGYVHRESTSAFVCSLHYVEGSGVERIWGTAVVHPCQNHVDNSGQPAQLQVQSRLNHTFFSASGPFVNMFFFSVSTIAFASTLIL